MIVCLPWMEQTKVEAVKAEFAIGPRGCEQDSYPAVVNDRVEQVVHGSEKNEVVGDWKNEVSL